jgi:hypothetical protein
MKLKYFFASTLSLLLIALATSCNKDEELSIPIIEAEETQGQLDPLDKGGRWLVLGIEKTINLTDLSDDEKAVLTNHFNDLALDLDLRCDVASNEEFLISIQSYPQEAIDLVEATHTRLCSDLNLHEGYWVYERVDPVSGSTIQSISDVQVDAASGRITVYAQSVLNGLPYQPAQVGPGLTTTTITGETAGHHPNAVYLNGSGEEFLEDVGGGSWWVKHSWIVDGEGYENWPLGQTAIDYGPGLYVEGILLDDGYSVKVGDLDDSDTGEFNIRQPIANTNPVSYHVYFYETLESSEPRGLIVFTCTESPSPYDGLARYCPTSTGNNPIAESFQVNDPPVTFELIEFVSLDEVNVWIVDEAITVEEFENLPLASNWFRQEASEEGDISASRFLQSPDATEEGVFTRAEHYGYQWIFNAQIIENDVPLPSNNEGHLTGRYIAKYQEVTYNAGRTISILTSPDGKEYVRISRDADRTTEVQIIPDAWSIEEREISEDLVVLLPNPTLNIIVNNIGDSFQGPIN